MKKLKGAEAHVYSDFNIVPPFTLMSRKPGIARQYFEDHPDIYEYDFINIATEKGGKKFRPPRYFDMLYDLEEPDKMSEIKDKRKEAAIKAQAAKLARTSLSPDELLTLEGRVKEAQIKALRRDMI